jgi:hypothetical protein
MMSSSGGKIVSRSGRREKAVAAAKREMSSSHVKEFKGSRQLPD